MSDRSIVQFQFLLASGLTARRSTLTVWGITEDEPRQLDQREVEGDRCTVEISTAGSRFFYAVAEVLQVEGEGYRGSSEGPLALLAVFDASSHEVALSEPSTVATVFCFAQFLDAQPGRGLRLSGLDRRLAIAYGMKNNFVRTQGALSPVIQSPPNGLQTNSLALLNFLSNLLYYSLVDPKVRAEFLQATERPTVIEALYRLARQPFTEVDAIYASIADHPQPYSPSLPELNLPEGASPVPNQWTLTVKFNDSGAENFLPAGIGYVVFDKNDRLWLANNVRQGTPFSSTFGIVLESDGSPAPFSPVFGGGLLGAGFGVAVDSGGEKIAFGNFGWGPTEWNPQTGSMALFDCEGRVLSPPNGYTNGLSRVQGLAYDADGNLWMASWGNQDPMPPTKSRFRFPNQNSALVVYLGGDPEQAVVHAFDSPYHQSFDVVPDDQGYGYISNAGSQEAGIKSSVHKFRLRGGVLEEVARWESDYVNPQDGSEGFEVFRQVTLSPQGDVFVVGVASNRVVKLDSDLQYVGEFTQNVHGPWGITFDEEGTMFVANFARDLSGDPLPEGLVEGPYGVTVIHDEDESTARLMTLPTGGEPVTLANGLPLYGYPETSEGRPIPLESHDPLMRLTAAQIDRAGNLWALNNWKPSAVEDAVLGDPGGDGVVAFVGVAGPRPLDR